MVQLTNEEKIQICQRAAEHLSTLRRLLKLSQARFGELAGISRARIIRVENGSAHLSWGQMTSLLCVCLADRRTKEYLYQNNVLGARFLQYMQQRDANVPPQTNITVCEELMAVWREGVGTLPKGPSSPVVFSREERLAFCEHFLDCLPELRRTMRLSQALYAELAGLSRARLIQLEMKKVRLSWSQMTSLLCVCMTSLRAKEYIYANNVLPVRFLQYMQQKSASTLPETNITVPKTAVMSYREMLRLSAEA